MKKLFLDDIRTIEMVYDKSLQSEFDIVRTYEQFVDYIKKNGLPRFISFDNDLGLDKDGKVALDGYAAAKWLVYESGMDLRNLKFKVHSANPVAAEQIKGLLNNYIRHSILIQKHEFGAEFISICEDILSQQLHISEWKMIESSDQFQTENYYGGFDATENEFTFSFYDRQKNEYWFQLSIDQISDIKSGKMNKVELRKPE